MQQIYINDANILIDLCDLDIVAEFLMLDFELCTTDFIINELNDDQAEMFRDKLKIFTSEQENLIEINTLYRQHRGLSFEDCSVWYYAERENGLLITSDGLLRKKAQNNGVNVRGLLHLFEEMKNQKCMSVEKCILKLHQLKTINQWAPKPLIDELIKKYKE